jgi:hypothetical protein
VFQVRRAIVHRRGLEMVHVLEVRGDEHGNGGVEEKAETLKN